jgi:hypothetical protein
MGREKEKLDGQFGSPMNPPMPGTHGAGPGIHHNHRDQFGGKIAATCGLYTFINK